MVAAIKKIDRQTEQWLIEANLPELDTETLTDEELKELLTARYALATGKAKKRTIEINGWGEVIKVKEEEVPPNAEAIHQLLDYYAKEKGQDWQLKNARIINQIGISAEQFTGAIEQYM